MNKLINFITIILIGTLFFGCAPSKYYGNYKIVYQIDNKMKNQSETNLINNQYAKKIKILPFIDKRNGEISIVFSESMSKYLSKLLIKKIMDQRTFLDIKYLENIKYNNNYNLDEIINNEQDIRAIIWGDINLFDYRLEEKQINSLWSGKKSIYNLAIEIDVDIKIFFLDSKTIKAYKINKRKNYELITCSNNVENKDFFMDSVNLWCLENSNFNRFFVDFIQGIMDDKIEVINNELFRTQAITDGKKIITSPIIQYPEKEKYISIQKVNSLEFQKNLFLGGGAIIGAILGSIIAVNMVSNSNNDSNIGLGGFGAMVPGFIIGTVTGAGVGYISGQLFINSQIDSSIVYANNTIWKFLLNWEI